MSAIVRHNISVDRFARAMKDELDANAHKGGWDNCDLGYIRKRLHQEVAELMRALDKNEPPDRVLSESADVANFAMMISELYPVTREGE